MITDFLVKPSIYSPTEIAPVILLLVAITSSNLHLSQLTSSAKTINTRPRRDDVESEQQEAEATGETETASDDEAGEQNERQAPDEAPPDDQVSGSGESSHKSSRSDESNDEDKQEPVDQPQNVNTLSRADFSPTILSSTTKQTARTQKPSTKRTRKPDYVPDIAKFRTAMIVRHNHLRKRHCVGPLQLSESLSQLATAYSEQMAKSRKFQHNAANTRYGENLWYGNFLPSGKFVADDWYNEIEDYRWSSPGFSEATGHFTQLIWKRSELVGIGWAKDPHHSHTWYVTAYYDPEGNVPGQFSRNVLRSSACSTSANSASASANAGLKERFDAYINGK